MTLTPGGRPWANALLNGNTIMAPTTAIFPRLGSGIRLTQNGIRSMICGVGLRPIDRQELGTAAGAFIITGAPCILWFLLHWLFTFSLPLAGALLPHVLATLAELRQRQALKLGQVHPCQANRRFEVFLVDLGSRRICRQIFFGKKPEVRRGIFTLH